MGFSPWGSTPLDDHVHPGVGPSLTGRPMPLPSDGTDAGDSLDRLSSNE